MEQEPRWENVESSTIQRVRYHAAEQKLQVEFKGRGEIPGKVAEYDDMTPAKYAAFMASKSNGKHFASHIRGNKSHNWRYL